MASSLFGKTINSTTTNNVAASPQNQQILNAMKMMNSGTSPDLLKTMLASNPTFQNVSQMLSSISDPKQAFYEAAKQRGIDPAAAIAQLRQMIK